MGDEDEYQDGDYCEHCGTVDNTVTLRCWDDWALGQERSAWLCTSCWNELND